MYWANILFWVIEPVEMLRIQYIGWVLQFSFPIQPTNDVTHACDSIDSFIVFAGDELISPCMCKGTQQFVHRSCLDHWRSVKVHPVLS